MKKQATDWNKPLAIQSDKEFVSRIHFEKMKLLQFNKKKNNPIKKWSKKIWTDILQNKI